MSECQQRVNDLIDLKLCSDGVKAALNEEDYEQAAAHLHRFLAMDENLLKVTASEIGAEEDGVNNENLASTSLDAALRTLHEAEKKVAEVVDARFDEAVKLEDHASIERFFKIFPLINLHDQGLKKFTVYLCEKVREHFVCMFFGRKYHRIHICLVYISVARAVQEEPATGR